MFSLYHFIDKRNIRRPSLDEDSDEDEGESVVHITGKVNVKKIDETS